MRLLDRRLRRLEDARREHAGPAMVELRQGGVSGVLLAFQTLADAPERAEPRPGHPGLAEMLAEARSREAERGTEAKDL